MIKKTKQILLSLIAILIIFIVQEAKAYHVPDYVSPDYDKYYQCVYYQDGENDCEDSWEVYVVFYNGYKYNKETTMGSLTFNVGDSYITQCKGALAEKYDCYMADEDVFFWYKGQSADELNYFKRYQRKATLDSGDDTYFAVNMRFCPPYYYAQSHNLAIGELALYKLVAEEQLTHAEYKIISSDYFHKTYSNIPNKQEEFEYFGADTVDIKHSEICKYIDGKLKTPMDGDYVEELTLKVETCPETYDEIKEKTFEILNNSGLTDSEFEELIALIDNVKNPQNTSENTWQNIAIEVRSFLTKYDATMDAMRSLSNEYKNNGTIENCEDYWEDNPFTDAIDALERSKKKLESLLEKIKALAEETGSKTLNDLANDINESINLADNFINNTNNLSDFIVSKESVCAMLARTQTWDYIKQAWNIVIILVPCIIIILSALDFGKVILSSDADKDMKKATANLGKRLLICVLLFLLPFLLTNVVLPLISTDTTSEMINCLGNLF